MHKKTITTLAAFGLLFASSGAALAVPFCQASSGNQFKTYDHLGNYRTDTEAQSEYFESRLRSRGFDARNTEIWNGCIRAWVPNGQGGEDQMFFDPRSFQPVQ